MGLADAGSDGGGRSGGKDITATPFTLHWEVEQSRVAAWGTLLLSVVSLVTCPEAELCEVIVLVKGGLGAEVGEQM